MGKLNGVLSKYEKQEQRMDALDKKMTLILEKLDELCQGSDQKESMESTDENRNIMVSWQLWKKEPACVVIYRKQSLIWREKQSRLLNYVRKHPQPKRRFRSSLMRLIQRLQ